MAPGREVGGILTLSIRVVVQLYKASGREDQHWRPEAGRHNQVTVHDPHVQAPQNLLANLLGLVFVYSGRHARVSATSMFGQVTKSTGANKHGIVVLSNTMRFCKQGVARVTQQVDDADMHYIYLPQLEIFLLVIEKGGDIHGGHRCRRGKPLPPAVFGEVSLTVPISAVMHGKLEHASNEDCTVAHTSPIHGPGFNIMGVGAHNNIAEHLVYGQCQIRVSVQPVQVVFVIVGSAVQPDEATKLDFDDGMEAVELITSFKIVAGLPQTKGDFKLQKSERTVPEGRH